MELHQWDEGSMLQVSMEEAIDIIQSLSSQISNQSANSGRKEMRTKDGKYFSIAVHQEPVVKASEQEIAYIYNSIAGKAKFKTTGDFDNLFDSCGGEKMFDESNHKMFYKKTK